MANTKEKRFEVRPFEKPIYAREVGPVSAGEDDIEIGDEVVLQPCGYGRTEDVHVRVGAIGKYGALTGTIIRANRLGSRGQSDFKKNATVRFSEKNVIRLVKKAKNNSE